MPPTSGALTAGFRLAVFDCRQCCRQQRKLFYQPGHRLRPFLFHRIEWSHPGTGFTDQYPNLLQRAQQRLRRNSGCGVRPHRTGYLRAARFERLRDAAELIRYPAPAHSVFSIPAASRVAPPVRIHFRQPSPQMTSTDTAAGMSVSALRTRMYSSARVVACNIRYRR